jgi:DNA topoisomerase IB
VPTNTAAGKLVIEAKRSSKSAGLIYVSEQAAGITRLRRGKRFAYLSAGGNPIRNRVVLKRIAKLAIPPAYEDVWICANPRGHIQATGRDARGRKQYRYHPKWNSTRDAAKFDRMLEFGRALPKLRRRLKKDLALPGLPREKVLATVVTLLDLTRIRIGNEEYARTNNSFGLTTLLDRHYKFMREGQASFTFRGKGGVRHEVVLDNRRLSKIIRSCQELPGQHLFQYVDEHAKRQRVDSTQVNQYLHEAMGEVFTAKDFRTWNATVRAFELLTAMPLPQERSARALKRCTTEVVRSVAEELRNTVTVCRKAYINPAVFVAWEDGRLHRGSAKKRLRPRALEAAALRLLRQAC